MIESVEQFMAAIRSESTSWPLEQPRWFRGEPAGNTPLVPSLYRHTDGTSHENELLQAFRARAAAFATAGLPERKETDKWLFLAQHVQLPTRLLDWSEGALIALYFALKEKTPVVWMLNPLHLNHFASGCPSGQNPNDLREFPLPWFRPEPPRINVAFENVRGAWENDGPGVSLPVAVHPSYVHGRLRAQRGAFTIHGKCKESLQALVPGTVLRRMEINPSHRATMARDLTVLGITESVAYPDLDGLARELTRRFLAGAV